MLKALIHRIVAIPWVYNLSQKMAGGDEVFRWVKEHLHPLDKHEIFLDVGCGTGIALEALEVQCRYLGIDVDAQKLTAFVARPEQVALIGDGTRMPLPDCSIDFVFMSFVAHHLDDAMLETMLLEFKRVLKPTGAILILDPLWDSRRYLSRFIWSLDRGSYPRTPQRLTQMLSVHLDVQEKWEKSIIHSYQLTRLGLPAEVPDTWRWPIEPTTAVPER